LQGVRSGVSVNVPIAMKISPLLVLLASCALAPAQDWPRYLGPDGTARVAGGFRSDWNEKAPDTAWKAEVGIGCAGFAVAGGRALTLGNAGGKDTVWCFEAASGKVLWQHSYPEALGDKYYEGGPNCTPTIDGDRVYTLSKSGKLLCLNLEDGKVLWQKDLPRDFGGEAPTWGYATAPLVRGDLLYTLPCGAKGALYALRKDSGEVAWHSTNKTLAGYAAPVFFDYEGKECAGVFHGRQFVIYDLEAKGKPVFEYTWRTSYDINASNPQVHDGMAFLASGYGMGYAVLGLDGKGKILHRDHDLRMIFQNSLLLDGDIVGVFGDKRIDAELLRMDFASGKIRWRVPLPGTRGSCLMVGDKLIALAETGDLVCGVPDMNGFRELGRSKTLGPLCWAPLAFADGRLYARTNKGAAVCLDVSK
jgi:outer membrane protein assembly factor BamB